MIFQYAQKMICVAVFATATASATHAQFSDPEQKKSWFHLQELTTEIVEVRNCMLSPRYLLFGGDKFLKAMAAREGKFVEKIEGYIAKYSGVRAKSETENMFRFRVWDVSLMVGNQKARPAEKLNCEAFLQN